jgi:hypothetical protein
MYGDTTVIRKLAGQLRERAVDIRRRADGLVGAADDAHWTGWAADTMRRRARDRASGLRRSAETHESAAEALDHHAREVDDLKALIAAVERRFRRLVVEGAHLAGKVVEGALSLAGGDPLDGFVPPRPGSKDWLDIDIPGQ